MITKLQYRYGIPIFGVKLLKRTEPNISITLGKVEFIMVTVIEWPMISPKTMI
jgi:hypothetical protein